MLGPAVVAEHDGSDNSALQALADHRRQADATSVKRVALVTLIERNVATAVATGAAATRRQAQRHVELIRADVWIDLKRAITVELRFAGIREAAQHIEAARNSARRLTRCQVFALAVFGQVGF
jgi:hypothetical protein